MKTPFGRRIMDDPAEFSPGRCRGTWHASGGDRRRVADDGVISPNRLKFCLPTISAASSRYGRDR